MALQLIEAWSGAAAENLSPAVGESLPGSIIKNFYVFFFTNPATPEIYTLSLHDALPISPRGAGTANPSQQLYRIVLMSNSVLGWQSCTRPTSRVPLPLSETPKLTMLRRRKRVNHTSSVRFRSKSRLKPTCGLLSHYSNWEKPKKPRLLLKLRFHNSLVCSLTQVSWSGFGMMPLVPFKTRKPF